MKNEGDRMKRFVCVLLILLLIPLFACADTFSDSFNTLAPGFNIQKLAEYTAEDGSNYYASGFTFIFPSEGMITVIGTTPFEVITVACCAIRAMDGTGDDVNQFGCVLRSYYTAQSGVTDENRISKTETGITVLASIENGYITFGLVR